MSLSIAFKNRNYECSPASLEEIQQVRKFIVSIIGEVTPLADMMIMSEHNPEWLHVVRREGASGYAGAFAIMHLKQEPTMLFANNQMRGSDITMEHIVKNSADAFSIYVGSIVSDENIFNRAATLQFFQYKMDEFRKITKSDLQYFSRPVSVEGLKTAQKMGYRPVLDVPFKLGDMIYGLNN